MRREPFVAYLRRAQHFFKSLKCSSWPAPAPESGRSGETEAARRNPEPKKRKRNLKTRDFVSEQRQRGATQKLEGAKYRGGKSARGFATD